LCHVLFLNAEQAHLIILADNLEIKKMFFKKSVKNKETQNERQNKKWSLVDWTI
jgi:hypothetical protein